MTTASESTKEPAVRVRPLPTLALAALLAAPLLASSPQPEVDLAAPVSGPAAGAQVAENFEVVGHTPLHNRGMNAALAVHGDYAYVGSRTDGKPDDANLNGSGVLVVDISDPGTPEVVHEIGPPLQGNEGETSRELRVWPQQDLLIVQNLGSNCSALIHACSPNSVQDNFRFYDISGDNAAAPEHVATYEPSSNPHEFYLWVDPDIPDRAMFFISATSSNQLMVTDISGARDGEFEELASWPIHPAPGGSLHSMTPTTDGTETHLAYLTGGYYIADTSDVVDHDPGAEIELITGPASAPSWPGPGAHSALRIPGSDTALVTDEVYGEALRALGHGCPWGWTRMIDISDRQAPEVVGEYRIEQNDESFCDTDVPRASSSYSAHNPTATPDVAFITWHSGGLQAVSLDDPTAPGQAGVFKPEPLPYVLQEDPALSAGRDKVVMWSFPIIQDGLVYVVDLRNGLYVLEYTGEHAEQIDGIEFLEGNSNLADALRFDPPHAPPTE